MILDPLHYLATLDRKPGALDHAPVFRDWKLPACFAAFRAALEGLHGAMAGARRFVRVLQLLGEHPLARVSQAVEACQRDHLDQRRGRDPADAVAGRDRGADRRRGSVVSRHARAASVHVPLPDLSRFDQLLGS